MVAYQGAGRVLDPDEVERIARWATDDLRPDLTVLLDLAPEEGLRGLTEPDRLESAGLDFHARARAFFLALAEPRPRPLPRAARPPLPRRARRRRSRARVERPCRRGGTLPVTVGEREPQTATPAYGVWADLVGQPGAVETLRRAARGDDHAMSHAWLVVGPAGLGPLERGPGLRRRPAVRASGRRRGGLRAVQRLPHLADRCPPRRDAGPHRAAVDRGRRGARPRPPGGDEPDHAAPAGDRRRGRRPGHRARCGRAAQERRGARQGHGLDPLRPDLRRRRGDHPLALPAAVARHPDAGGRRPAAGHAATASTPRSPSRRRAPPRATSAAPGCSPATSRPAPDVARSC